MKKFLTKDPIAKKKREREYEIQKEMAETIVQFSKRGQGAAGTAASLNFHTNDLRIRFEEGPHEYYVDNKKVKISVSGFIGFFYPDVNLDEAIKWIFKDCPFGCAQTFRVPFSAKKTAKNNYVGMTKFEVLEMWKQSSANGTKLHACIEHYFQRLGDRDPLDLPLETKILYFQECKAYMDVEHKANMIAFFKVEEKLRSEGWFIYRSEWNIFYEEYSIAGGVDAVFQRQNPRTGETEYCVVDWKRVKDSLTKMYDYSESGKYCYYPLHKYQNNKYSHYQFQINTYAYILKKNYGLNVTHLKIIQLVPNSIEFIVHEMPFMHYIVELCLKIWLNHLTLQNNLFSFIEGSKYEKTPSSRWSNIYPSFPYPVYRSVQIDQSQTTD